MSYLDETRVGIWGWGYGGFVTAMVLGAQQPVYKCGISVSPITDFLYYSKYNISTFNHFPYTIRDNDSHLNRIAYMRKLCCFTSDE